MNLLSVIAASRRRGGAFDADAADYFARGESAGSTMTPANKALVDAFIRGIKEDEGVATLATHPIKASCIIGAWDTLAGALVPLVGPAPTNVGPFEAGDYSRTTGLVGDGSTKYLDSNRNNNADPQDSKHLAAWITVQPDPTGLGNYWYLRGGGAVSGGSELLRSGSAARLAFTRSNALANNPRTAYSAVTGFAGSSRAVSTEYVVRVEGSNTTVAIVSETPANFVFGVFGRSGDIQGNHRMSFYSIGENLNLAQLDARLATLMGALT